MADERMTPGREAEIRNRDRIRIYAGQAGDDLHAVLRELDAARGERDEAREEEILAERDSARADLAELVAALPKCSFCDKPATRDGNEFARHLCDDSHGMWGAAPELPYAGVLRRLAREGGSDGK